MIIKDVTYSFKWGSKRKTANVVHSNSTPIYAGSEVVGQVRGNIFFTSINTNHIFGCKPTIILDLISVKRAVQAGAIELHVTDIRTGIVYQQTLNFFRRYGKHIFNGIEERVFLESGNWIRSRRSDRLLSLCGSIT